MAKKVKTAKKKEPEVLLNIREREWRIAVDSVIRLEKDVVEVNQRIDRLVVAIDKCKRVKGI